VNDRYENIHVKFYKDEIIFPNGYFFKHSLITKTQKINAVNISEINLNTYPPSLVYQAKEIIFIKDEYKDEFQQFAEHNNIPIVQRFDIWEHINRPYLDTEFEDIEKKESLKLLAENGISKIELGKIRRKVIKTMFINFIAWEWAYLGLFDYLNWTFLTKKKYWWSMEIAMRNFK